MKQCMVRPGLLKIVLPILLSTILFSIVVYSSNNCAVVLEIPDPVGDDHGPGSYVYPTNSVFQPGVFDLIGFRVEDCIDYIVFRIYLRELGGNPWNAPNNFSLQYIQVYVRTTREDILLNKSSFGANVEIVDGWHYAILVTPGWGVGPVPFGEKPAIYYSNGSYVLEGEGFSIYADHLENSIVVSICKSLLVDTDSVMEWSFTVLVLGYDGFSSMRIRPVLSESSEWFFGGGDSDAVDSGVAPLVIDLLVLTSIEQYGMLSSYNVSANRVACIHLVSASSLVSRYTVLETTTTTIVETTFYTKSITVVEPPLYCKLYIALSIALVILVVAGVYIIKR